MTSLLFILFVIGAAFGQDVVVTSNFTLTCLTQKEPFDYKVTMIEHDVWNANDWVATITGSATTLVHDQIVGRHGGGDPGFDYEFWLIITSTCGGIKLGDTEIWVDLDPDCKKSAGLCSYENTVVQLEPNRRG